MSCRYRSSSILLALLSCGPSLWADVVVINFDSLSDGDPVTTQFAGVTFVNASVVTAGVSVNEFEFPPHSGTNEVFDSGGPITIRFADPVLSFGGFFTYDVPLTLDAFDAGDNLVFAATSAFASNLGLSGDPGSSPNEFLAATVPGIVSVTIAGDPGGGSFVLDDATITPIATTQTVPEPPVLPVLLGAAVALAAFLRRRRCQAVSQRGCSI